MQTLAQIIEKLISTATVTDSGCVIINRSGRYPWVMFDGTRMPAHRAAYLYYHGELPTKGHDVCHTCDVTQCIAEGHLVAATHAWNMSDRDRKGRGGTQGEKSPLSKLTKETVLEIDKLISGGVEFRTIATQFGISPFTVKRIAERTTWRHLWKKPDLNLAAA